MSAPKRPCVLIVDDEPSIAALLEMALQHEGIAAASAHDARQACELFTASRDSIEVLVTDILMPGTNGIELAQHLISENPDLRVLFVSGYCSAHDAALRGFECLAKPFRVDQFVGKIRSLLTQRRKARLRVAG